MCMCAKTISLFSRVVTWPEAVAVPHALTARKARVIPLIPISTLTNCAYDACGMASHGVVSRPREQALHIFFFCLGNENFNTSATATATATPQLPARMATTRRSTQPSPWRWLLSYVFRCLLTDVGGKCSPRAMWMCRITFPYAKTLISVSPMRIDSDIWSPFTVVRAHTN